MRCDNCGWMNPEGIELCQKCNQKLKMTATNNVPKSVNNFKEEPKTVLINCDKCGCEYDSKSSSCPNCGFANTHKREAYVAEEKNSSINKTVAFGKDVSVSLGAEQQTDAAVSEIPNDENSVVANEKGEINKTVIIGDEELTDHKSPQAVPNYSSKRINLKATVIDVNNSELQQIISGTESVSEKQDEVIESYAFKLEAMDYEGDVPIMLTITATAEIGLEPNDIILVAGNRYRVI